MVEHPITPPQWQVDAWCKQALAMGADVDAVFLEAARWGADQELEACCADLQMVLGPNQANWLRAVRRPKPPSLKEHALGLLNEFPVSDLHDQEVAVIRRALESLPD